MVFKQSSISTTTQREESCYRALCFSFCLTWEHSLVCCHKRHQVFHYLPIVFCATIVMIICGGSLLELKIAILIYGLMLKAFTPSEVGSSSLISVGFTTYQSVLSQLLSIWKERNSQTPYLHVTQEGCQNKKVIAKYFGLVIDTIISRIGISCMPYVRTKRFGFRMIRQKLLQDN